MDALRHHRRKRGAALVIVLAFVVLLTGLVVAYFSRTSTDRQVAQVSFNQTKVDQVAASGMDLIVGGIRQEITGPSPTPTPPYLPATNTNMVPMRFGTSDSMPNLVRRSVRDDGPTGASPIPAPGIASLASAVNSAPVDPANPKRGEITLARWNKHYLIPKADTSNDKTDPVADFVAPDWVILTRNGPVAFSAWDASLANQTPTNNSYAVGRYAYAIYDEGQLLDINVAGYPSGTTPDQSGRKGPVAFSDLTLLPYPILNPDASGAYQIDRLVGWRNYGSTQPSNNFPNTTFAANFRAGSVPALAYWNSLIHNISGFVGSSGAQAPNGRTDQAFLSRQQLIAFRRATLFDVNALQYLGTFLRELNAPSWKPSTPPGSTIDYATLANTPTPSTSIAINRDLLNVRVANTFTRPDGTTAAVGDALIKRRFPLSRINGLADPTFPTTAANSTIANGFPVPASATTVQRDFGLLWNSANSRWDYVGATGSTVQSAIERLDQVAAENREPNFFELLKAVILNGSVGVGSGFNGAPTFVLAENKYHYQAGGFCADHQIMQIGANIIDQWDSDNVPTFIGFKDPVASTVYEIAGVENLPYLNKLVFKPAWIKVNGKDQFAAWLLPSLWNPHQNAPPASQNVRVALTMGTMTGFITYTGGQTPYASTAVTASSTQYMTVDAASFGAPGNPSTNNPSAPRAVVNTGSPSSISASTDPSPGPYYGFRFNFATNQSVTPANSLTAYPDFGAGCDFQTQVQVGTAWKTYQTWKGCGPNHPLIFQPPPASSYWTQTNLQDPEFVTLDPRTLRFGVWGNAAKQSLVAADYTDGTQATLDLPTPRYELITALGPSGTNFSSPTSPNLYLYAKNDDATVRYKDLDTVQRRGDIISGTTTAMLPTDFVDRPQILNRPFQSVAELGQVFRDQPWKTLDFTTAASADAGLLDVFTLHESANEAGKTSLNTRQKPILTAILSQATKRLTDPTGTTVITSAQRDSIVNALFAITSAQPMIRKTDLLTQLAADPSVTSLGNKEARELVMRAFSDACQTRTWNLMIDVIAQSGRYPANASTLAGFLVEGEQHYWVHVAIDRFTGQVIDKQIEVVNE